MYEKQVGYQLILSTLIFPHFVKFSEEGQLNLDTLHATELIKRMIRQNTILKRVKQPVMLH